MAHQDAGRTPFGWVAVLFSLLVLAAGLAVSVATGQWWPLLCASGLVIVPAAASRRPA
ncbi:hypothetical protein AB6N23_05595 [Cellulomonas sp. 179-A 9B4 NHS]|uniref:hypothetical protein n=1 Tax=Cellulomonas sp. 179-A 9B4 NHS TaxID=3142379 RepID=UPI0039A07423